MMRKRWPLWAAAGWLLSGLLQQTLADEPPLPLKLAGQVQFQTQEGTWICLDVSPDGRTVLFDLLGELYTLDIAGGHATRVLGGLAFESQPRYSRDGRQIAFISDRSGSSNLWIADADGTGLRQISQETDNASFGTPAWSVDGQSIYVTHTGKVAGLWAYQIAGGAGELLAPPADLAGRVVIGPAPSPDGRYLYFASAPQFPNTTDVSLPAWEITRRDLASGREVGVVHAVGSAMHPVLSPNGQQMVYATRMDGRTGLRLRDLNSGADRWLAYPVQLDTQGSGGSMVYGLMPGFAFAPGGDALILSLDGKIQRLDIATGTATNIPFTADVSLDVGPRLQFSQKVSDGPVRARLIQSPQQSPNGRELAFSALGGIYRMRLPHGTPQRLTQSHAGFQPSWSADGRFLVYVSWDAGEGGHVWRIPAHGGTAQRLTQTPGYYSDPVFDTDGESVYALRSSTYERTQVQKSEMTGSRLADIVRLGRDGTSSTVLSQEPQIRALRFSPSAKRLSFEGEGQSLQSIRTDGGDRRSHVSLRGLPGWAAAPQLSPDGRWALVQKGGQLYLLSLTAPTDPIDLGSAEFAGRRVSTLGADYFAWANGGKTITWALGRDFHRVELATIERAAGSGDAMLSRGVERMSVKLEVPRDIPRGTLVLRGATAITMRADEVIENADIVIVDNRIAAVGRTGQVPVPKHAVVRDVSGRFIVPGFIDTHAHWIPSRFDVLDLHAWSFIINLAHGVTAGLDVQSFTQDVFAYADMIDAGLMVGLRTFSTGRGIGFSGERVDTAQEAQLIQRRYREAYDTRNLKAYSIGNRHNRQLFINAAESLGMMPTIEGIELHAAITHAIDGFHANEHEMGSVRLYRDVIELFARTGTGYNPTLLVADGGPRARNHFYVTQAPHENPKINRFMPHFLNDLSTRQRSWSRDDEQIFPGVARGARDILEAGGRVGVGSHGEFQGLDFHWEMQALASGGMTPMQVLHAATRMGSEIIGRGDDLGSLEPGKLADLLILSRDPLQDIRNAQQIEFVMKNGRLYVAETLDEVWPRQRPMPPAWFTKQMPAMRIGTP